MDERKSPLLGLVQARPSHVRFTGWPFLLPVDANLRASTQKQLNCPTMEGLISDKTESEFVDDEKRMLILWILE